MKFWTFVLILMCAVTLYAQDIKSGTEQTFDVDYKGVVSLTRKGYEINKAESKDGKVTFKLPFDLPSGEYSLTDANNNILKTFNIIGMYPEIVKRDINVEKITLKSSSITAGQKWDFSIFVKSKVPLKSDTISLIFEKEKDVSYYATSVKINKTNKYSINIPKEIPAGNYNVLISLNNDVINGDIYKSPVKIVSKFTEKTTNLKPIAYGFYKDLSGLSQAWWSNQNYTLFWCGEPQLHVSGMLNGPYMTKKIDEKAWEDFKKNIDTLESHGIKHVYLYTQTAMRLRTNYAWENMRDYLEERGFTYTVGNPQGNYDLYPKDVTGWLIRANKNNIKKDENKTGIFEKEIKASDYYSTRPILKVNGVVTNSNGDFLGYIPCEIISSNEDKTIVKVKVDVSKFNEPVNVSYSMYIDAYYEWTTNFWGCGNKQIDFVNKQLSQIGFGPGFRGIIDLISPNERGIHMNSESIFFDFSAFKDYRINQLKNKYKSINELKIAWKVEGNFVNSIEEAAGLFPIYNNYKKIYLSDNNGNVYILDGKSIMWYEYIHLRDKSFYELEQKQIVGVKEKLDVPVLTKMIVGEKTYNSNLFKNRLGVDGLGYELYSTEDAIMNFGLGYRYGELLSSNKALVGFNTEINRSASETMYPNYPDLHAFIYDMSLTNMFGGKQTYLFLLDLDSNGAEKELFPRNRCIRDQRMLEWMNIWEEILYENKDKISNFKPYVYTSWPVSDCWWPNPSERRALFDITDAPGTENIKASNGVWVINSWRSDVASDKIFVTLNDAPGTEVYKNEFETLIKNNNKEIIMLGLRKNIGALSVDKYYKNEYFSDDNYNYQALNVPKGATIIHKTDDKVWGMKIGNLQIIACEPKYYNSLEDVVKFAQVPTINNKILSTKDYIDKIFGIEFATYGNNNYKVIGYKLNGKNITVLHTTKSIDENILKIKAPNDCVVEQYQDTEESLKFDWTKAGMDYNYPSLKRVKKEYKKGDIIEITFPKNDPKDENIGVGKGTVKITGLNINDLIIENMSKDTFIEEKNEGYGVSGLIEGLSLPMPQKWSSPGLDYVEAHRAMAALNKAIDYMDKKQWIKAYDILNQFQGCCQGNMLEDYFLALGNVKLLSGYTYDAINYYEQLLRANSNSQRVKTALGCAYYNTDKEKAIELWKECDIQEAKDNIKFAENNK